MARNNQVKNDNDNEPTNLETKKVVSIVKVKNTTKYNIVCSEVPGGLKLPSGKVVEVDQATYRILMKKFNDHVVVISSNNKNEIESF